MQQIISLLFHALPQRDNHISVIDRVTQAVNAGNAGNDNHIIAFGQGRCCRMAEFLNFFIDSAVFFNVSVGACNIRFRLIIVVIGDKVFYCVVGEKFLEFRAKLCCQRFIMCQNQCWFVHLGNDISHCKGLSRSSHSEQGLFMHPATKALDQLMDSSRLIACRLILGYQLKFFHTANLLQI